MMTYIINIWFSIQSYISIHITFNINIYSSCLAAKTCPNYMNPTRPETNSLPLKIDPWKRRFLLETTIFRVELLVLGRVSPKLHMHPVTFSFHPPTLRHMHRHRPRKRPLRLLLLQQLLHPRQRRHVQRKHRGRKSRGSPGNLRLSVKPNGGKMGERLIKQ